MQAAIDKTFHRSADGEVVYKADVDALKLASRCHEDGLNIDPEVFGGTEAQRQARQVDAIARLFAKFEYQDVTLTMFSDVPPYLLQEAKRWRSKEVDAERQKIATDRKTHRQLRNRDKSKARLLLRNFRMGVQTIRATPGALDAKKLRVTSTGWQGLNINRLEEGAAIRYLHANAPNELAILLRDFRRVPYADDFSKAQVTIITDCENRAVIARGVVQLWMLRGALAELERDTHKFFRICLVPFTEADMAANARGAHYFSIIGIHRNNLEDAARAKFDVDNAEAIAWFFREGGPMRRFDAEVSAFVRSHFPRIVERIEGAAKAIKAMFGDDIRPKYGRRLGDEEGIFYNFCANAPRPFAGIPRVHCSPHVDHKNLAICVCVILIYGHFNHRERCWLVIWEAGLIIELPPGVMLAYPSSLFFHWNVDVCDLDKAEIVVTEDGQKPDLEKGNTKPLTDHEKWDKAHGRGSMVWFNQATLFQSAELGVKTIKAATARRMNATSDYRSMVESGYFPEVAGASDSPTGAPTPELSSSGASAPGLGAPGPFGDAQHSDRDEQPRAVGERLDEEDGVCDMSFSDDDLFEGAGGTGLSDEGEQSDGLGLGMGAMGLSDGSEDVQDMELSSE
ncbi:hypothetical protein K525DRAFT_269594 [Schizophyllum commune Loenen D]|nr:hypothetical protein K525DRAFT_269594 [Schizophyllum commune Loenen D]